MLLKGMERLLVIADDFSGAAEIAGIGLRHGIPTRLSREPLARSEPGLIVLDTDSRDQSEADASDTVKRFVEPLEPSQFDLIFKKTDSALRGPIRAEIQRLLDWTGRDSAMFVPQNPSRGRTIRDGIYRIDGVPLDQTAFAHDPQHPARSARVSELLSLESVAQITVGEAETVQDVQRHAGALRMDMLPAGGADWFTSILSHRGYTASHPMLTRLPSGSALFVCGSASDYSRRLIELLRQQQTPACVMPHNDFPARDWADAASRALRDSGRALMCIDRPIDRSPGAAQRFQTVLSDAVANVLSQRRVDILLLEGGATASAVCSRMGWTAFAIEAELSPGIVMMRTGAAPGQALVVKPGSYPWPSFVFS